MVVANLSKRQALELAAFLVNAVKEIEGKQRAIVPLGSFPRSAGRWRRNECYEEQLEQRSQLSCHAVMKHTGV